EDEGDGAGKIACLGKILRRAQKHRHVAVMTTGMHLAGAGRGVGPAGLLGYGEGIHVGAQADGRTVAAPAPDKAHDTRAAEPRYDLVAAELLQLLRHEGRRLVDVEQQLGILMQVSSPGGDLV